MARSSLPVGFRFHPTEEELIDHYLKNKINGQHNFDDVIPDIDICRFEPWDLPELSLIRSDDEEWFYFSRVDYKSNGNSRNRATKRGFWKITGKERAIKARRSKALIGNKRTLNFYKGKVRSGEKTGWVIHEYCIPETLFPKAARQRDFVLCRLKKKDEGTETGVCDDGEVCQTSRNDISGLQNIMADSGSPIIPEKRWSVHSSQHGSPDYLASMPRDNSLLVNAGYEDHCYTIFRDAEEGDYTLEDILPTNSVKQGKRTSALQKVYDEGIHQQDLSIQDTDALLLNQLLPKQTSCVDVAANLPPNINRIQSVNVKEPKDKCILQSGYYGINETGGRKDELLADGAEYWPNLPPDVGCVQSVNIKEPNYKPTVPPLLCDRRQFVDRVLYAEFGPDRELERRKYEAEVQSKPPREYTCLSAPPSYQGRQVYKLQGLYELRNLKTTAQRSKFSFEALSKLTHFYLILLDTIKPPECPKPIPPELPMAPEWLKPMEDEQKIMRRKQTKIKAGEQKSSFVVVRKESPLGLASCSPAAYLMGGLVLSMFVAWGFSCGVMLCIPYFGIPYV